MSEFTARTSPPIEECNRQVLDCAVYLGLLGPFYGSMNEQTVLSYTEYEYTVAKNAQRALWIFLLPEQSILSISVATKHDYVMEHGVNFPRQQEFKKRVRQDHVITEIKNHVEEFKAQLRSYLQNL